MPENTNQRAAARDVALVEHGLRLHRINAYLDACKDDGTKPPEWAWSELADVLCDAHSLGLLTADAEAARAALDRGDVSGVLAHVRFAHSGKLVASKARKPDA